MGKPRARNPTRGEKELISTAGLIAKNWHVIKNNDQELVLVSKGSGRTRRIKKAQ